jgi:hypothetical protein
MSTRAYKLIEVKTEELPTFSVSKNWDFVESYAEEVEDGGNMITFYRENITAGIEAETDAETLKLLRAVLADFPPDESLVEYYCF